MDSTLPHDGNSGEGGTPHGSHSPEVRFVWRNTLTMVGAIGTALMLLFMVGFLIVDLVASHRNPYVGVFTFLVIPVLMSVFAILAIVGLLRSRRRLKRLFG